jgi:hypothetical protein
MIPIHTIDVLPAIGPHQGGSPRGATARHPPGRWGDEVRASGSESGRPWGRA